jgi:hypothetical protein
MSRPDLAPDGQTTVRTVLNALLEIAAGLPLGLDTQMEFGVCDGLNLQLLNNADLISYHKKAAAGGAEAGTLSVLLRAHHHGKAPGEILPNGTVACGEGD